MSSICAGPRETPVLWWPNIISTLLLIAGRFPILSQPWHPHLAAYPPPMPMLWEPRALMWAGCLQPMSKETLTRGPVPTQQLWGAERFRVRRTPYFQRPGYLFWFSRCRDSTITVVGPKSATCAVAVGDTSDSYLVFCAFGTLLTSCLWERGHMQRDRRKILFRVLFCKEVWCRRFVVRAHHC